jgi:putative GTP pyrophosphokinase
MEGRDWQLFLIPYEQAVEELKVKFKAIRADLKKREEFSPIEFVTARVKRVSSILEKAQRLHVDVEDIETGIEDIAGMRIMCQFVEDIDRVSTMIRNREDMTLVYEKDYVTNHKDSGYRSHHMIMRYPVQTALGMHHILVEIQIRTLAMNFWATIEHSLNYKFKDNIPAALKIRLQKAAEAAYNLDMEMSSIRNEIIGSQRIFEDRSTLVASIMTNIQELYFYHRVREAAHFQLQFNELWEKEDFVALTALSEKIRKSLSALHPEKFSSQED